MTASESAGPPSPRRPLPSYDQFVEHVDRVCGDDRGHGLRINERRFFAMLRAIWPHLEPGISVCDLGGYPGTFVELLAAFAPELELEYTVVGLLEEGAFQERMAEIGARVVRTNLDPYHDGLPTGTSNPDYRLGGEEGRHQVVVASEILEHMVHPSHLLKVANEALVPGGKLLLTTPNQAWLRHRLDLLRGLTPNTTLEEGLLSGRTDDWRPHVRIFTMAECRRLLEFDGFSSLHEEFLDMRVRENNAWWRRLAYLVPALRHGLLLVAGKQREAEFSA